MNFESCPTGLCHQNSILDPPAQSLAELLHLGFGTPAELGESPAGQASQAVLRIPTHIEGRQDLTLIIDERNGSFSGIRMETAADKAARKPAEQVSSVDLAKLQKKITSIYHLGGWFGYDIVRMGTEKGFVPQSGGSLIVQFLIDTKTSTYSSFRVSVRKIAGQWHLFWDTSDQEITGLQVVATDTGIRQIRFNGVNGELQVVAR